jgi:hypothetical protein
MADCPTCGLPVKEGERFCAACGGKLPVIVKQKTCKMCGNTLIEGETFCSVCGTPANPEAAKKEEEEAKPVEDFDRNPTMDEIQIPVITDDIQALKEKPLKDSNTPTMDSVWMPGQEPPKQPEPTPAPAPAPAVTLEKPAQPAQPAQPTAAATVTPESAMPNGQNTIPNYNNTPNTTVIPGKTGNGMLVPIILIILIIAVILVDVLFLFRDNIFGEKSANSGCATVPQIVQAVDISQ